MSRLACLGPMDRPAALQLASLLKWGTTSFLAPFPCTRRRADNLVAKNENPSTGCLSGCSHVLIAVLCAASDRLRIQRCNPCALPNRCQRRRLPSTAAQSRRLRAGFDLGIRPQRHLGDGGCRATFLVGAPRHSRVAERNSAIAAAALLAGAFMWSARQRRSTDAPESAAPETFEQGCSAARASSGLPANASAAFRRGFAACKD